MSIEKKLRILMLEDSVDDIMLIQRLLLKNNFSAVFECVDTREEFTQAISSFNPDVVLSDHGLPGFNSREALRICLNKKLRIPFILVTGMATDEFAISCIREGADDYILKSNLSRLPTAINAALKKRKLEKMKRTSRYELRDQNAALAKANTELDKFLYSVSHNLRGPLASAMGILNIARDVNTNKEMAALYEMMNGSLVKLDNTMRGIQDHSKNSRDEMIVAEINWVELFDQAFSKINDLLDAQLIDKVVTLNTDVPFLSDPERLGIVLVNVLTNCVMYRHEERKLKIEIDIITTQQNATITIRDNGLGIEKLAMPRIFDMFYRGTERSRGDGLGLYIAKEVISRQSGEINVSSIDGEQTTVLINLPNQLIVKLDI